MAGYPRDAQVVVHPFSRQPDGDVVIIGDVDRQVFLTVPPDGLELLDALANGKTVGDAVREYESRHNETPDIDDFLGTLEDEGFVSRPEPPQAEAQMVATRPAWSRTKIRWSSHLEWLPVKTCQRLTSRPVIVTMCATVLAGITLVAIDPGVWPLPTVLVFKENFALNIWIVTACMFAGIMAHEVAHVIGARAAGIPARIGIGNRLYVMVIETDMSGIWLTPKRSRYVAFLSGPLLDAFGGALVIGVLFAERQGMLAMSPELTQLISAILWTFQGRLMWQCFFFLRTDFYYVFANLTGAKDLKADTENLLRNLRARFLRIGERIDQSFIPLRERRTIRFFVVLFVLGNVITIAALVFVTLPILFGYGEELYLLVTGQPTAFSSFDFVTLFLLSGMIDGLGIALWVRALYLGGRRKRAEARVRQTRALARAQMSTSGG